MPSTKSDVPAILKRDGERNASSLDIPMLAIGGVFALVAGLFCASQFAAGRFGFDPRLGVGRAETPAGLEALDPFLWILTGVLGCAGLVGSFFVDKRDADQRTFFRTAGLFLTFLGAIFYFVTFDYLYAPYAYVMWAFSFWGNAIATPILLQGLGVLSVVFGLGFAMIYIVAGIQPADVKDGIFGSARFGDGSWFASSTESIVHGIPVGYKPGTNEMLFDDSGRHAFVCAPTGAGKTVGFAVPTLLSHHGSMFVLDIKGELAAITARYRGQAYGQQVRRLDPFGKKSDSFNPMDLIHTEFDRDEDMDIPGDPDHAFDNAKMLAEMLVIKSGAESQPFFTDNARQLLTGLILYVACTQRRMRKVEVPDFEAYQKEQEKQQRANPDYNALFELEDLIHSRRDGDGGAPAGDGAAGLGGEKERTESWVPGQKHRVVPTSNPRRSLVEVRRILMLPDEDLQEILDEMSQHPHAVVQKRGAQFARMNERTFSSVVSTARSQTEFLDSPSIQQSLVKSTFDPGEMKSPRGATVYLIMPIERLDNYIRYVRLMTICAQIRLLNIKGQTRYPTMFLLDEFPRLQRFDKVDEGLSAHRGFGIQYLLIVQSVAQLKEVYGDLWQNFITNTALQILWAPNDQQACEFISDLSGDTTVTYVEQSSNQGRSGEGMFMEGASQGTSETTRHTRRRLIQPEEARTMDSDFCFVFSRSEDPVILKRPMYVFDDIYQGTFDPNPFYTAPEEIEKQLQEAEASQEITPEKRAGRAFVAVSTQTFKKPRAARLAILRAFVEKGSEQTCTYLRQSPERFGPLKGNALFSRNAQKASQKSAVQLARVAARYFLMKGEERMRGMLEMEPAPESAAEMRDRFYEASRALCTHPTAARIHFVERCQKTSPARAREAFLEDTSWVGPLRIKQDAREREILKERFATSGARYVTLAGTRKLEELLDEAETV